MAPSHTVQPSKRAAPCSTEQEGVSDLATAVFTHQHLNACSDEECPNATHIFTEDMSRALWALTYGF